jgi:hypothetical protein
MAKRKRTNNDIQNITHTNKDRAIRITLKTWMNSSAFNKVIETRLSFMAYVPFQWRTCEMRKFTKIFSLVLFFLMYNYILYQIKFMLSTSHETQDDDFNFVERQATIKLYGYPKKILKNTTPFLVLYVCFVDRCLSFCTFSFGHSAVCSSSIYGF